MALVRWDPFAELDSLHSQVNSLFNDAFGGHKTGLALPTTDVYSNDKSLVIEAHLPSFKEDEVSLEQHQGELAIRAEHQEKQEDKNKKKYLLRESVSKYYRRFTLPKNADTDAVTAHFEDGVLKVEIPFKELPAPKKIQIGSKSK
jgi:HSP20 family protein